MPRPSGTPRVSSPLVPALLRLVRARGEDPALLAVRFGLADDAEAADEAPVEPLALGPLLEAASDLLREPYLALALPDALPLRRYRFAEVAARASATLRDGLAWVARGSSLLVPRLEGELREQGDELALALRTPGLPRGLGRHAHEYAVAHALAFARRETGRALVPRSVWFAHARPRDVAPLLAFLGTREVAFGAEDSGFALAGEQGALVLASGDARLLATVEPLARAELAAAPRAQDLRAQVAARVEARLPDADVEGVARALHMSARTLQRRLGDEGTRFSEVLDPVREAHARRWLADASRSQAEIADALGFADLATFGRAFKRWTGTSPGAFRRA